VARSATSVTSSDETLSSASSPSMAWDPLPSAARRCHGGRSSEPPPSVRSAPIDAWHRTRRARQGQVRADVDPTYARLHGRHPVVLAGSPGSASGHIEASPGRSARNPACLSYVVNGQYEFEVVDLRTIHSCILTNVRLRSGVVTPHSTAW
jgi:hypothetical protein